MAELDLGRVVGNDGISPGGNLLDNSNWQKKADIINQRGQDSYKVNGYTIDRWRTWSAAAEVSISDSGLTTTATLYQYLDIDPDATYTAAVCKSNGSIVCITGTPRATMNWSPITVVVGGNGLVAFTFTAGTYKWAALYKGAFTKETLPAYAPKGYAVEFAECQRYYRDYSKDWLHAVVPVGEKANVRLFGPVPMRLAEPTLVTENLQLHNGSWSNVTVSELYHEGMGVYRVRLITDGVSLDNGRTYLVQGIKALNADL